MNSPQIKKENKFFLVKLYRYYVTDSIKIVKASGFKELLKQKGWKFLLLIVIYYAIRDAILYLLIPYLIAINVL